MQEEVNEKTIALCIKGGKISADILKNALAKLLREMEKTRAKAQQKEQARVEPKAGVEKRGETEPGRHDEGGEPADQYRDYG